MNIKKPRFLFLAKILPAVIVMVSVGSFAPVATAAAAAPGAVVPDAAACTSHTNVPVVDAEKDGGLEVEETTPQTATCTTISFRLWKPSGGASTCDPSCYVVVMLDEPTGWFFASGAYHIPYNSSTWTVTLSNPHKYKYKGAFFHNGGTWVAGTVSMRG